MTNSHTNSYYDYDAIVIGGGFYGSVIAVYLAQQRGLARILLIERESALLSRASYNNQARVHNGYHYPRSYTTAFRSRVNMPLFCKKWQEAVRHDFTKLYAIARRNSKVTAKQFVRFCKEIGAKIEPADEQRRRLFEPRLVEDVFLVEEYAFDATELKDWAERELKGSKVEIRLESSVTSVSKWHNALKCLVRQKNDDVEISCRYVFNCTYSRLNQIAGDFCGTQTRMKHEITEMALIQVPPSLEGLGVTVMDGSFFSMMPFPAQGLHTLSHVRYTPHLHWDDQKGIDPYQKLNYYEKVTRVDRMVRDAGRYLPSIFDVKYVESLFEIKTVLLKNETDDGRPILFEKHSELPGLYTILGGKIDNIFDVLEKLDSEEFSVKKL